MDNETERLLGLLDFERGVVAEDERQRQRAEHAKYLSAHPELRALLRDFVAGVLAAQPSDVAAHARAFFATLSSAKAAEEEEKEEAKPLRPLVVMGPSGVGKGTLIARLTAAHPDAFGFSVSHTTRAPRPGEADGVHYHFTDRATMQAMVAHGEFLEHADVHGKMYGTSAAAVAAVARAGRICVLDVDVQGGAQLRAHGFDATFVFVDAPSYAALEARLRGRGTETEDAVLTRLANARGEVEASHAPGFVDVRIVNDDLDTAVAQLEAVVAPELRRRAQLFPAAAKK